ncbi:MAG: hypothetical protein KDC34_18480 [Saprospiraceae bacterium]|nr:hypothetical protein [Saprospiraceae bacterium]
MEIKVIIWSFIIIFGLSAILTLLGITGVIKSIQEKYLNALFGALILEVIAAILLVFKTYDFSPGETLTFSGIIQEARIEHAFPDEDQCKDYVLANLRASQALDQMQAERDSLRGLNLKLLKELEGCQGDLTELDNDFYTKVSRLRKLIGEYSGSINLGYRAEEKEAVYALLEDILAILGYANGSETLAFQDIRNLYRKFEERNGRYEKDESIISEFETTLMIREYLNKYYPVDNKSNRNRN